MYSTGRLRPERQLDLASAHRFRCVRPPNAQTGPRHVAARTASAVTPSRCLATTPDRPWPAELLLIPCSRVRQSVTQTQRGWPWRIRHTLLEPPHWNPSHEAACDSNRCDRQRPYSTLSSCYTRNQLLRETSCLKAKTKNKLHISSVYILIILLLLYSLETIFMVLSSWQGHCKSSPSSFDECRRAPAAVDPQNKSTNLDCESTSKLLSSTSTIAIYYYSAPKPKTNFTVPRRIEG